MTKNDPKMPSTKDMPRIVGDDSVTALQNQPDLILAIAGTALVDRALEFLFRARFRELTADEYTVLDLRAGIRFDYRGDLAWAV
jgi:hypothetical protein